jgi:hypothetical protein
MDAFVVVKKEVKDKGLTADVIAKVLEIIEFAEDNDVKFYLEKGKLRMKSTIEPVKKKADDKGFFKGDNPFSGLGGAFDDIFKTKKK